jgi:uncharacterized damage-inducible protein DinB
MTLDYTDQVCAHIPDDMLDWRPEHPAGNFMFSLAEIAMHCADARLMFARQLSGDNNTSDYWSAGPDEAGKWLFRPYGTKQAIIDSLAAARGELEPFTSRPAEELTATTPGTESAYSKTLSWMKEQGQETAEAEARGPATIMRVLMALTTHESGHRGSLMTLLHMQGVKLKLWE